MNITEISIKRPSLIIVLFGLFILLGYIGYTNLSYELMPDFNQPVVVIKTGYPGAEPEEVETSVSRKIEDAFFRRQVQVRKRRLDPLSHTRTL